MLRKRVVWGIFLLLVVRPVACSAGDLIKSIVIEKNKVTIQPNDSLKARFLVDDFFVEYDADIDLEKIPQSIVTLPFLLIIFSTVWASGETYYVDSMDWNIYYGLRKLKKIYKLLYPKTQWKGRLIPRKVTNTTPPAQMVDEKTHVAILFSGGLDSTVSSFYHRAKKQLLITAWGQYDFPLNKPELWAVAKERFQKFADDWGHSNAFLRSNYSEFFNHNEMEQLSPEIPTWRMFTIEDIGWAGLTAPILYAKGYPVLLIASSDSWEFGYPSAANPFVDSTMNFAGIRIKHDGFNLARFAKAEYLVNFCRHENIDKPYLTICQQRCVINCNDCGKCLATVMALFALGERPEDYGFYTTVEEIRPRVEKYLRAPITSLTKIERFSHIQNKIRQRLCMGDDSAKNLQWLLDIDLLTFVDNTYEKKIQKRIPWKDLHGLCPEIEVPAYYLDPDHKHPLWVAKESQEQQQDSKLSWLFGLFS